MIGVWYTESLQLSVDELGEDDYAFSVHLHVTTRAYKVHYPAC